FSALLLGILLVGLEPEEMLTAGLASGRGLPELAINNVIGTNITIITCALGLAAVLAPVILPRSTRRLALLATLVSLIPIALLFTGLVNRLAGVLLLILFAVYTFFLLRIDRRVLEDNDDDDDDKPVIYKPGHIWRLVGLTLLGLVVMSGGGYLLVEGAQRFVSTTGLQAGIVGGTIVALATASEMIALGMTAARKKQSDVLVGGILGSFAYNLLVTLGLAAVINPLPVDFHQTLIPLLFMLASHLVLLALIWRGRLGRGTGSVFILGYVAYLVLVFVAR
ncbi:MAG: sodium:calcium antiporter, partial [Ktedonobacteraceae bacterium]